MTPEEIDNLKLSDVWAIFKRASEALELLSALGIHPAMGGVGSVAIPPGAPDLAPRSALPHPTPEELSRRAMLLEQFPKEIQDAERHQ